MSKQENLQGTVEKVVYRSDENGFTVLKLQVNSKKTVTVTGYIPDLHAGEYVALEGAWGFHQKFGRQFVAQSSKSELPSSALGIKKYLGSGLIKGIGPKFAERLVNHFKEKTLEIIDKEPDRLYEVSGVGEKRVQMITVAWDDQKEISKVMVFLHEHEVSTAFAVKIYKTYGENSIKIVEENPYRLSEDIWGIGFKSADKLALKLGIDMFSIRRIKAGVLHVIAQVVDKGDLYAEVGALKEKVYEVLGLDEVQAQLVKYALRDLYNQDKIKLITKDEIHYITLPQYYFSEKGIAKKIEELQKHSGLIERFNLDDVYSKLRVSEGKEVSLSDDQQHGIISCLQNKISIITGGPGTGKTTLVKKLLDALDSYKIKYRLAAPTGRAAKRMFEGTGRNAETVHRLLEFDPSIMNFSRNEQNALDTEFLIIDEASMIDVFLMYSILRALPQHAHLLLLGDVDQLPSVGAGNVLHDLIFSARSCTSKRACVVRLTEIFRQAQDSLIIVNAYKVNNGEFPVSYIPGSRKDFVFIKEQIPENIFPLLKDIYKRRLPAAGILPSDSIVLTPMNRGIVGTQRLNQELQMILNPQSEDSNIKEISRFGTVYRVGDSVMQIRNNYTKFVFNGDIGQIVDINFDDKSIMIKFDSRTLEYEFAELDEIVLSYAVSIHKSQGSEFAAVIIPIFLQHFILLQRNLIYTAITRAKKLCILMGQPKAIAIGINKDKGVDRKTFLHDFLTSDLAAR